MLAWNISGQPPVASPQAAPNPEATEQSAQNGPAGDPALTADPLVEAGTLWEAEAETPREAQRSAIQVAAEPLQNALAATPGTRLSLALSPHFSPLEATVTSRGTQADGTVVTRLRVEGSPEGTLTLQENRKDGFFTGHLFYGNDYPIAYQFTQKGGSVEVSRHAVPDLVCSELDGSQQRVELHGLPPGRQAGAAIRPEAATIAKAKAQKGLTVSVSDATVNETTPGVTYLTFNVRLSKKANSKKPVSVDYSTANGTAVAGTDYQSVSGTLTFPAKSTVQTITVPIPCDNLAEDNKSFTLNLSNPVNATLANSSATGTIIDDDATPEFSVGSITVVEGDSGAKEARIPISLKQAYVAPVSVKCATSDLTAVAGVDYDAASGTIVFKPGETQKFLPTNVYGDNVIEGSETFRVSLSDPQGGIISVSEGTVTITDNDAIFSYIPDLNSLPGAEAVIYLDFDGEVVTDTLWNNSDGDPIVAQGVNYLLTPSQMSQIWQRVTEDFSPFHITVTTNEAVYLAAPPSRRIRCIVTANSDWFGYGAGGVAYVGSFTWSGDTPCWVFSDQLFDDPASIAEAASHEIGHTLGLSHDGRIKPSEEYYEGQGTGQTSWAPIMGVGYYSNLVQWSKGEYAQANNLEDDLAIITGTNGFGYRTDDVGNTNANATAMAVAGNTRSASGIIETRDDVDVFEFTTTGGGVLFSVAGDAMSQNLDILAEIYDTNSQLVASANPDSVLNATVTATLPAGTYYLHVSGVGRGDPKNDGYSDYGSLGQYSISGIVP